MPSYGIEPLLLRVGRDDSMVIFTPDCCNTTRLWSQTVLSSFVRCTSTLGRKTFSQVMTTSLTVSGIDVDTDCGRSVFLRLHWLDTALKLLPWRARRATTAQDKV